MKTMIFAGIIHMVFMAAITASFISPAVPGWIAPAAAMTWAFSMKVWAMISWLCPEGGRHYAR